MSYKKQPISARRKGVSPMYKTVTTTVAARPRPKAGTTRTAGYYGRYGQTAVRLGNLPENKFFDTQLAWTFDNTTEVPASGQLVLIPQGDTESTRDGRQCTITSIAINGFMSYAPGAAALASGVCYLHLMQDLQCNGAAATAADVFLAGTQYSGMHNLANSSRFRTLKKWSWTFNPGAGVTTAFNNVTKTIKFYKKCHIPLEFSGTTGAITEIKSNNLFLVASSQGNNMDDTVTMTGFCRVRFMG